MIRNRHDATAVIQRTICILFISSGAAGAQTADNSMVPVPACPQIPKVCALIADPAVRDYVGLADYAWNFNVSEQMSAAEEMPPSRSERRLAKAAEE